MKNVNLIYFLVTFMLLSSDPSYGQESRPKTLASELMTFSGNVEGSINKLSWATFSGQHCESFVLQRSYCTEWEDMAILAGKDTNESIITFEYLDTDYRFPNTLYRLKSIRFDGSSELEGPVIIARLAQNELFIWPNPATSQINVQQSWNADASLRIMDSQGKDITHSIPLKEGCLYKTTWDISSLAAGMYFMISENKSYKFIKS